MCSGSSPALSSRLALRPLRSTWNLPVGSTSMEDRAAAPMASVMALGTSSWVSKQHLEMPGPTAARMSSRSQP